MARGRRKNMTVSSDFKEMIDKLKFDAEKARGIRLSDIDITAELTVKQFDKFARRVLFG